MTFTEEERAILSPFVTDLDKPIFVLKNLPEVIKGALFSRYSRSSKGLRRLLLDDFIQNKEIGISDYNAGEDTLAIQKAQDFFDRILDGYGDDSIGELGGAHIAFEQISQLGAKFLEDARIGGSPLEKSTRYILFDKQVNGDYMFYKEPTLMNSSLADTYLEFNRTLFKLYSKLMDPVMDYVREINPQDENTPDRAYKFTVRATGLDSLRNFLPASTLTNVGIFGNGRFFETLIVKARSHQLAEMRNMANDMQDELGKVIPSFVRRAQPDHKHFTPFKRFITETKKGVQQATSAIVKDHAVEPSEEVTLVDYDKEAEEKVLATILYPECRHSLRQLRNILKGLDSEQKLNLLKEYMGRRTNRRHKPGRAAENAYYTFDLLGDFGIYRDLQRHRTLTQERQELTVKHGYDKPTLLYDAGCGQEYEEAMAQAVEVYEEIYKQFPQEAQYVVPLGYKIRWYNTINLRAIYWMAELRSSPQGHTNYRRVAQKMYQAVKDVHPTLAAYMKFVDMNDYSLGRLEAEKKTAAKKAENEN